MALLLRDKNKLSTSTTIHIRVGYKSLCFYLRKLPFYELLATLMLRIVFWDVLSCKMIVDRRFRGVYCLHHKGWGITHPWWFPHPWWWRQYAPLKRRSTIILHDSTSQKTILNIILAAVRNLTRRNALHVRQLVPLLCAACDVIIATQAYAWNCLGSSMRQENRVASRGNTTHFVTLPAEYLVGVPCVSTLN
jgi:hypothetical protein